MIFLIYCTSEAGKSQQKRPNFNENLTVGTHFEKIREKKEVKIASPGCKIGVDKQNAAKGSCRLLSSLPRGGYIKGEKIC